LTGKILKNNLVRQRDGANFKYILNYIRIGKLNIPEDDIVLIRELLDEAEFYQLGELHTELKCLNSEKDKTFN
jgi:hypothetical protein